jgi:hypothetical protein
MRMKAAAAAAAAADAKKKKKKRTMYVCMYVCMYACMDGWEDESLSKCNYTPHIHKTTHSFVTYRTTYLIARVEIV